MGWQVLLVQEIHFHHDLISEPETSVLPGEVQTGREEIPAPDEGRAVRFVVIMWFIAGLGLLALLLWATECLKSLQ